jgi:hypothetical protein
MLLASARAGHAGEAADRNPIDKFLGACMDHLRERRSTPHVGTILENAFGGEELIPFIEPHLGYHRAEVRYALRYWLVGLGQDSDDLAVRRRVVDKLMEKRKGDEEGWTFTNMGFSGRLLRFTASVFSEGARARLVQLLAYPPEDRSALSEIILLVGVADIKSQIPVLKALLSDSDKYDGGRNLAPGPPSWEARKARARMGVEKDIRYCIRVVESEPDPDRRILSGLQDLSYIRQPEIVDYLRKQLDSRARIVPPGMEEHGPIRHAAYAVGALHTMMLGFPIQKHYYAITNEDIEICRRWMKGKTKRDIIGFEGAGPRPVGGQRIRGSKLSRADQDFVKRAMQAYVEVLGGDTVSGRMGVFLARAFGADIAPRLEAYTRDGSDTVRHFAYKYLANVGHRPPEAGVRRDIVEKLARGMGDVTARRSAYEGLLAFTRADFSRAARETVTQLLAGKPTDPRFLGGLALVVGVADIPSQLPVLKGIVDRENARQGSKEWWESPGWAAMRARARMGVEADVERCIELVEAESNVLMRLDRLFRDLSYVRQRQVVAYFRKYLDGDKALPDRLTRSVAPKLAIGCLARMIRGFPVKKKGRSHSKEDVKLCREWMAAYDLIR